MHWAVGLFFLWCWLQTGGGRKEGGYLYSAQHRIEFSRPEGLKAGSSQKLSPFGCWVSPANRNTGTCTIFFFENTTVKLR